MKPKRLIKPEDEVCAKTVGERRARPVIQLTNGFQANLVQAGDSFRRHPKSCKRQGGEGLPFLAVRQNTAGTEAGERPSRPCGSGDRTGNAKPLPVKPFQGIF